MIVISFVRRIVGFTSCRTGARACEGSFDELAINCVDHGFFFIPLVPSNPFGSLSGLRLIILSEEPI